MAWDYSQFKGAGGGTAAKPATYSDQAYKNLQSSGGLGGSTTAERIISDELKGYRPGQSETHTSGTFFDDDIGAGDAGTGGAGGAGGAGDAGTGSTGSLGGLQAAAGGDGGDGTNELTPPSLRQGIGVRTPPQESMVLAGLRRAY